MTPTHKPEDGERAPISNRGLERIRQALEAGPTPGEWSQSHRVGFDGFHYTQVYEASGETIATLEWHARPTLNGVTTTDRAENAEYIAACNPVAIRALLAAHDDATALLAEKAQRIERLEAALRELLEAETATYPSFEEGSAAQSSWAIRQHDARREARAALSQPHPHGG